MSMTDGQYMLYMGSAMTIGFLPGLISFSYEGVANQADMLKNYILS